VYLYDGGDGITLGETVMIDSNGGGVNSRKYLVGTDSNYAPLANGSYCTLDGDGTASICLNATVDYVTIKNIYCHSSTSYPLQVGGASYYNHYTVINCKAASTAETACFISRGSVVFSDCDFRTTHSGSMAIDCFAGKFFATRTFFETASTSVSCIDADRGSSMIGCIVVGGTVGLGLTNNTDIMPYVIAHCNFYNQVTSCIQFAAAAGNALICYNNLFWVADTANDYAITAADPGTLGFEDYNFTNAETPMLLNSAASGWLGANSDDTLWSDTEGNLWTDAANDDFTLVDTAMIDDGMPTLGDEGDTPVNGYSTPGAHQLTQTQSGGGSGGGAVIIGGGIVR
jgi:hypothetical protein